MKLPRIGKVTPARRCAAAPIRRAGFPQVGRLAGRLIQAGEVELDHKGWLAEEKYQQIRPLLVIGGRDAALQLARRCRRLRVSQSAWIRLMEDERFPVGRISRKMPFSVRDAYYEKTWRWAWRAPDPYRPPSPPTPPPALRPSARGRDWPKSSLVRFDWPEKGFRAWVEQNPKGWVVNYGVPRLGRNERVLHRANCSSLQSAMRRGKGMTTHTKVCSPSRAEIRSYESSFGKVWRCPLC